MNAEPAWLLTYSVALILVYGAVTLLLIRLGLMGGGEEPAARKWPAGSLGKWFGVVLVLTVATVTGGNLGAKVDAAAAQARGADMAVLLAPPRIPDAENGAIAFERAKALLGLEDQRDWVGEASMAWDLAGHEDRAIQFLGMHEYGMDVLRESAELPGYHLGGDYTRPLMMQIPNLVESRTGANLLGMRARFRAAAGEWEAALSDIQAIRKMGFQRRQNPSLISLMISLAIDNIALENLERSLGQGRNTPGVQIPVEVDDSYRARRAFRRAMRFEEAGWFSLFGEVFLANELWGRFIGKRGIDALPPWARRIYVMPADLKALETIQADIREALDQPVEEWPATMKDLSTKLEGEKLGVGTSLMVLNLMRAYEVVQEGEARDHLFSLALACTAYLNDEVEYPKSLSDLEGKYLATMPVDPFSGGPYRMVHEGTGIIIYSVGVDRVDDGGKIEKRADLAVYLGEAYRKHRMGKTE